MRIERRSSANRVSRDDWWIWKRGADGLEKLRGIAEHKWRGWIIRPGNAGIWLGVSKAEHVITLAAAHGVPGLFIVENPGDRIFFHKFRLGDPKQNYKVNRNSGRTVHTRDPQDIEDCIVIPVDTFERII